MAPLVTFEDNLKIQDGKQEVLLRYLGKGHTDGDIVLLLPSRRIAFVGDLFFNEAIPNVQDASMLAWMKTLEEVLKLDADTFVPGHGPAGSRKEVETFRNYFEELHLLVKLAVDRGDSMDQVIRDIRLPPQYHSYLFQNFFPSNVQKMYAEIKALQKPATPERPAPKR